jgi:HD-like signal output (HDOD) protein
MVNALDYASRAQDIFVLPDAVIQIKRLIEDQATDIDDIADILNYDPALTGQILRIANSALFKFPNKIESVSKAIQVIGTNSVYDLVFACGICKAFSEINTDVIDLERYWENSVYCGLLCKYFAERLHGKGSDRLFVAGLLHNIGELVMVNFNPDLAQKCAQFNQEVTPVELQLSLLDSTYANISATLVKMWGIPDSIVTPIRHQHCSQTSAESIDDKIIQLSYILALDSCYPEIYAGNANLDVEMYESLGLNNDDLETALNYAGMQSLSVLALFNPSSAAIV